MDSGRNTSVKEINGVDLNNYFIQKRAYNSVVYVHKKYLEEPEPIADKVQEVKVKKEKKNKKEKKQDKCQQFASDSNRLKGSKSLKIPCNNNTVLDQTIKFAKNIVPLIIPPDDDKQNIYYTIKTSKKHRHANKKPEDASLEHCEIAPEQENPKKIIETYRKVKKERYSVQESISHSSNNTLEDLNINQSLCCTFSEHSEKKYHKKSRNKRPNNEQKFVISESFEAVATENVGDDAKIKIHLMNEKDKHFLSDTIKEPVLNAIRDCILEVNNNNAYRESSSVQKYMKCNSQKLDNVLDKLTSIEKMLNIHEKKLHAHEKILSNQQNKLEAYEQELHTYENRLDSHEAKLSSHEVKLRTHEEKLSSYENKLDLQVTQRDPHAVQLSYCGNDESKKKINSRVDSNSKENKVNSREANVEVESKIAPVVKVQPSNTKPSTLEELGADLIEMDEEYSSEEELHQELLDRRSKSTVVVELAPSNPKENRMEILGGGEVPPAVRGASMGPKLERPNRIPARFCWTDTVRKN